MNPIDTRQILNWDQVKVHLQPNLCIECQLVPQQPLQCYRCQKLLCQTCHGDLKQKSRGPKIFCQKCKALNYFNPANNAIYQSYRDMVIGCVNRRYGCKVTLDYKKYQKHAEECEFQRIPCPSPGCFVTTLKRAKGDHLQVCEYVIETCQYCNKQFNRKSMAYHQVRICYNEMIGKMQWKRCVTDRFGIAKVGLPTTEGQIGCCHFTIRVISRHRDARIEGNQIVVRDPTIEEQYQLMSYQEFDSLRSRRMAFSLHKQRLASIKGYENKQISSVVARVERMRSDSINRRKQVEQQQLGEENQRIKIKLMEIANEKKALSQQVKLCQAKKKLQQLIRHQQNMMENLILMKKITNVTSSITHRVQQQDFHLSKFKQLDRYLQDDDKSFLKPSLIQSPNHSQQNSQHTQHTKTLDATHIKLSELRVYSNGQLLQ